MVSCLKNNDGLIQAYVEWYVLNHKGQYEHDGKFLWIQDLWIHESQRRKETLRKLIKEIDTHPFSQSCVFVYWRNLKRNERLSKVFLRSRLAKMGV